MLQLSHSYGAFKLVDENPKRYFSNFILKLAGLYVMVPRRKLLGLAGR